MNLSDSLHNRGILLTFIASVVWAIGYFVRKLILDDISPVLLTFFTSVVVAIAMFLFFKLKPSRILHVFCNAPVKFLSLSFIGVVLGTTLMFTALLRIDLGVVTLIEKTQPLFVLVLAAIFLRERVNPKSIPYIVMAVLGSYMVSQPSPFLMSFDDIDLIGVGCILGTALCWAVVTIIGKALTTEARPEEIVFLRFAVGGILLCPVLFFMETLGLVFNPSIYLMAIVIGAAVMTTGLGYFLYYEGLKTISANVSAFIELVTPVIAVCLGIVFLHERLNFTQTIGAALLLPSIYMIISFQRTDKSKQT